MGKKPTTAGRSAMHEHPATEKVLVKVAEEDRNYLPEDELSVELMGPKEKQAQMRYNGTSPAYFRLGRKIIYRGSDLNIWANARRFNDPADTNKK